MTLNDLLSLPAPTLALVCISNRLSIPPDVIYQVPLDPAHISPSRSLIHFDQRTQQSDLHGWFHVEHIQVIELLCECDVTGNPLGEIYALPTANLKLA